MRFITTLALAALGSVTGVAAQEKVEPPRPQVVSTGKKRVLVDHLRKEGTTVFLFINETSTMEQTFLQELEKKLPPKAPLGERVVGLKNLDAEAAKQHEITATPTALVADRFGKPLARTSSPDEIMTAVARGLRKGRILWIDEEDPKAAEIYGRPPDALKRGVPGIVKTMSLRADVMQMFMLMSRIHFSDGFLDRSRRPMGFPGAPYRFGAGSNSITAPVVRNVRL